MVGANDVLLAALTKFESIDNSLQPVVSLLESINSRMEAIATDTHTNTQQLATIAENQARNNDEFAELRAMIRQQHETSQQQAATTERLVSIVETLIQQRVA